MTVQHIVSEAEAGIVGAGPAGARLAELLAARGVEVLLWDPKAPWEKPCGGGLTAAAVQWVPELAGAVRMAQSAGRAGSRRLPKITASSWWICSASAIPPSLGSDTPSSAT